MDYGWKQQAKKLRILFIGNNKTERCGVAEFGRHCVGALRGLGHEVLEWDSPRNTSGPANRQPLDITFFNWHAGTLGALDEEWIRYLPGLKSAYLHESSPAWNDPQHRPPLLDQVDVAFVDHPSVEGATYFRTPVWDVIEAPQRAGPEPSSRSWRPWIGTTGIRGEGTAAIREVCEKHGWLYSESNPKEWLSPEQEVNRLALCWINVAWYGAGFGGQASAMGALIAAGQPILINSNRMLETWQRFAEPAGAMLPDYYERHMEESYKIPPQLYLSDNLEEGLLEILADIRDGKARRPTSLREAFSWKRQAERMTEVWERRLG